MPVKACVVCARPFAGPGSRCPEHAIKRQQRPYRGLAAYERFKAAVLERDAGICAICHRPGAGELGHVIAYALQDPATRDDPTTWRMEDFRAVHGDCNKRLGTDPIPV